MHFRRLACLLLGGWLGGSLLAALVAYQENRSASRLMAHPAPAALVFLNSAGRDGAHELLRYHAAETRRAHAESWESLQLAFAAVLLFALVFGTHEGTLSLAVALLMLAVVVAERFLLTPETAAVGRGLDFVPRSAAAAEYTRLTVLQTAHSGLEIAKAVFGFLLAARLMRGGRSAHAGRQVDMVDKPDYRHVNR